MIKCEMTEYNVWYSSAHHLKKQGVIVWIGIDPDDEYNISVQISNDKEPFEMQQRILIVKEHY